MGHGCPVDTFEDKTGAGGPALPAPQSIFLYPLCEGSYPSRS